MKIRDVTYVTVLTEDVGLLGTESMPLEGAGESEGPSSGRGGGGTFLLTTLVLLGSANSGNSLAVPSPSASSV